MCGGKKFEKHCVGLSVGKFIFLSVNNSQFNCQYALSLPFLRLCITVEYLDKIHEEMKPEETLLICCKAFQEPCESRVANINIKKIPHMLLGRCEFGKDHYSLNIVNVPLENEQEINHDTNSGVDIPMEKTILPPRKKSKKQDSSDPTLF